MAKHKHADLIKAWADGAEIEILVGSFWHACDNPSWDTASQYRIKPKHSIGNTYKSANELDSDLLMIVSCTCSYVVMVTIEGSMKGCRLTDPVEVKRQTDISEEEFQRLSSGIPLVLVNS